MVRGEGGAFGTNWKAKIRENQKLENQKQNSGQFGIFYGKESLPSKRKRHLLMLFDILNSESVLWIFAQHSTNQIREYIIDFTRNHHFALANVVEQSVKKMVKS